MKKKYHLFFGYVLVFPMLLLISTACSTPIDTLTGGISYYKEYVVTQNGDINDPNDITTEKISSDYNTFLIINDGDNRKIYFGGLLPDYYYADQVNINCNAFGSNNITDYISKYQLSNNGPYYYYIPFSVYSNFSVYPGEYTITAKLQLNGTVSDQVVCTLKVADSYARGWTLDVYQQIGYNSIYYVEPKLKYAFNEMQVPLVIEVKSSILDAEIINWDRRDNIQYFANPIVAYAYSKVYPILPTQSAIAQYAMDFPNRGLLFYIKDYNNYPPGSYPVVNGVTFAQGSTMTRLPVLCFVFVQRVRDNWAQYWADSYVIPATSIHETGHLWCDNFTDTAHLLWHNGDNLKRCVMIDPYVMDQNHNPDAATAKILEYSRFCEGHLQRGLNVSWYLKQYAPFGRTNNGGNQDLYAYIGNQSLSNYQQGGDKLQINIESAKNEYIKGQLIDILVRIKNITNDTLKLYPADHHLYSYEESKTINSLRNTVEYVSVVIPPNQEYIYLVDPLMFVNHKKEDKGLLPGLPWFYWPEGSYDYYVSYTLNNAVYTSNKISITINSVPDSLSTSFEELKRSYPYTQYKPDIEEVLFEKYKGTFYEKEYLYSVISKYDYYDAITSKSSGIRKKACELYKEFILKYPDASEASVFFGHIYGSREINSTLLKEISDSLRNSEKGKTLFKIIENQKEYWFKEIDDYGF